MNRKRSSLVLLSIIAPISLLIGFKLSGMLEGGPIAFDTITADTVTYNMTRPNHFLNINRTVINYYNDTFARFSLRVDFYDYLENSSDWWDNADEFYFGVTTIANVSSGFIYSCMVRFSYTNNSLLDVYEPHWIEKYNLNVIDIKDMRLANSFVYSVGVDQPQNSSLVIPISWILLDHPHLMQSMTISAEILQFDGTAYQKCVIPIFIEVT